MSTQKFNRAGTIQWYDEHSENYDSESFTQDQSHYGGDMYRIQLVRELLKGLNVKNVLDVGCGTGEPMLHFLKEGYNARGFDFSPGMIAKAQKKLADAGYDSALAQVGDILDFETLKQYGREQFDVVIANGVLPYIENKDLAHAHLSSLVRPGGYYISAYVNELFDLMTLNRFTVQFHWQNFIQPLPIDEDFKNEIRQGIEQLIVHPDKPTSIPEGARDYVYVSSTNPLTIAAELMKYGLRQTDLLFFKFHAFAPLLRSLSDRSKQLFFELSRTYELDKARDWRGHFLASTFIVVAKKE